MMYYINMREIINIIKITLGIILLIPSVAFILIGKLLIVTGDIIVSDKTYGLIIKGFLKIFEMKKSLKSTVDNTVDNNNTKE